MTPSEREPSATSEVFPCPFCGCEGVIVEIDGAWIAGCDAGQVRLEDDPTCRANAIGFYHKTREGAIAAWNRRVDGLPVREPPPFVGVDQRPDGCWFACIASLTGIALDEFPAPPA